MSEAPVQTHEHGFPFCFQRNNRQKCQNNCHAISKPDCSASRSCAALYWSILRKGTPKSSLLPLPLRNPDSVEQGFLPGFLLPLQRLELVRHLLPHTTGSLQARLRRSSRPTNAHTTIRICSILRNTIFSYAGEAKSGSLSTSLSPLYVNFSGVSDFFRLC